MYDKQTYQKQYYEQNKQKIKDRAKAHYEANREVAITRANQWQKDNRETHNASVAKYAESNPDVAVSANKRYREKHSHTIPYRVTHMLTKAKKRAADKGWEFDLDKEYLTSIWPAGDICPVYGTPFVMNKKNSNHSASLDRIDSSKGYVRGNVIIVSWRANDLKSNASLHELEVLLDFYKRLETSSC